MKTDTGEPNWIPKSYGIWARGRLTYSQMWKRIWITAPSNGKTRHSCNTANSLSKSIGMWSYLRPSFLPYLIPFLNLYAPHILYIGQTYRCSPEYFYIFSQQIYLLIFSDFPSPSSFIPPQNVVYFLMLPFLVNKIFTFYINGVINCKCPAPGTKG